MTHSFWDALPRPIFLLAPMADVTDAPFRRVIAKYSKPHGPHAMWTEFVSADGLLLADERGKKKLMLDLIYSGEERPIVAQFFTADPERMERAAALARKLGFDGIDINMGCPDRSIEKQGAGAALIKSPKRAQELVAAARRGAGDLPVSVKTRIGYGKDVLDDWLPALLASEPVTITIHARTRKEMSKVPAHWERVRDAVTIRDKAKSKTLIVGNGDVLTLPDARARVSETGCDGVMIGKGIFGTPWLFNESLSPTLEERLHIMVEHTNLFEKLLGAHKSFAIMKKHFKAYVSGFDGAHELRMQLMDAPDAATVSRIVESWLGGRE